MWFFIDPFSYSVWLSFILCVPIYILAMSLADYLYKRDVDFGDLCGFVIRNALSEQNTLIPNQLQLYKRLLIIIWILCMMVLVLSYAGTLTAMLAKSKLQEPITTFEELLHQNEVSWIISSDLAAHYLRTSENGSILRKLYEHGTVMNNQQLGWSKCLTKELIDGGMYGSLCAIWSILVLMKNDYRKTGKCNYYMTKQKFLSSGASLAFQEGKSKFTK